MEQHDPQRVERRVEREVDDRRVRDDGVDMSILGGGWGRRARWQCGPKALRAIAEQTALWRVCCSDTCCASSSRLISLCSTGHWNLLLPGETIAEAVGPD